MKTYVTTKDLDRQAAEHEMAAKSLRNTAAILGGISRPTKTTNGNGTDVQSVINILTKHKGLKRGEIREMLPNVPPPRINAILRQKNVFSRRYGKWTFVTDKPKANLKEAVK